MIFISKILTTLILPMIIFVNFAYAELSQAGFEKWLLSYNRIIKSFKNVKSSKIFFQWWLQGTVIDRLACTSRSSCHGCRPPALARAAARRAARPRAAAHLPAATWRATRLGQPGIAWSARHWTWMPTPLRSELPRWSTRTWPTQPGSTLWRTART